MKVTLTELRTVISDILSEAKKKKEKAQDLKSKAGTAGAAYGSYAEAFDFSAPLGGYNLYKSQGAVNWGPMTGAGPKIDDRITGVKGLGEEAAIRAVVREVIQQDASAWDALSEAIAPKVTEGPWEEAKKIVSDKKK